MFLDYELKPYHQTLAKDFSAQEISAIIDHAIIDLKNRNIAGIIIVPCSFLVGGFATDYASEQSALYIFLGCILGIATLLRIVSVVGFSKMGLPNKHIWIPLFFWSNILVAIVWGCFTSTAVLFYHSSLSITLIIILLSGISGGSIASYCIWRRLSYTYLLLILIPPIIAELYIGNAITIPIGVAIWFFLIFNLVQTKLWNSHFWLSLINTFQNKKNSQELEKLNTQLNDEITDHKETATAIATSRKKLEDIYNSAHDGICILEPDGHVIDINETILEMFHVNREEALQFDMKRSFLSSRNKDIDFQEIWQGVLQGKDQEFIWLTQISEKDEITTNQVNLRRSLWGDDHIIIATIRDITVQTEALNATIAANRAKSEFLANMSHELRTPMHGILGYARLGTKRSDIITRKKIREYFSIIQESGTRLMRLIDNVLDFSKMEVGKMNYTMSTGDLFPRIQEEIDELNLSAAEKGLRFEIECPNGHIMVFCDQEKIAQVLRNLLFNAIKFSDPNSQIRITCKEIESNTKNPLQQITVANTGIPIPVAELSTIFDKFAQSSATNTGAGGTGLGLAISKQILRDHNSIIWAENGPGGETRFSFLLGVKADQTQKKT